MQVNYIENERLKKLKKKYSKNKNVIFSENYPCIEYWFLIHYENIKTHFRDSKSVINYLKRHIKNFDKSEKFLSKDIWVKSMCSEGKFEQATERSRNSNPEEDGSYSTMYKALDVLKNPR